MVVVAKKVEMPADEMYLQAALRAGTCAIMEVSLKALGEPDVAYQARVVHLDMGHVHRLSQIHDVQGSIGPVVIFRAGWRMILADGFHRHEMARRKKLPALRAYVVDVEADRLEHEARLFASMCNQQLSLTRTREDIKKAVKMLLEDEECWRWTDQRVANHCGCSSTTVGKYRLEISRDCSRPVPDVGQTASGRSFQRRRPRPMVHSSPDCSGKYHAKVGGKSIDLGSSPDGAEEKLDEILARRDAERRTLSESNLNAKLVRRGFLMTSAKPNPTAYQQLRGYHGHGVILTWARFHDKDTVPWAVGCLVGLRALCGEPATRLVVVCFPGDGPAATINLYRGLGFEFLTPDELIASLAGPGS